MQCFTVRIRYVGTVRFFCNGTGAVRWYAVWICLLNVLWATCGRQWRFLRPCPACTLSRLFSSNHHSFILNNLKSYKIKNFSIAYFKKSNFKQKNYFYDWLSKNTLLVPKNLEILLREKNLMHYLQTVFRLSVIQKQETPKTLTIKHSCNFCC